jgi:hypothetical protein
VSLFFLAPSRRPLGNSEMRTLTRRIEDDPSTSP